MMNWYLIGREWGQYWNGETIDDEKVKRLVRTVYGQQAVNNLDIPKFWKGFSAGLQIREGIE